MTLKVDDRRWREMMKRAAELGKRVVKVGVIGTEAANETEEGITVGRLAGVHEYGAAIRIGSTVIIIPERSFIRATLAEKRTDIFALVSRLNDRVLTGRMSEDQALGLIGTKAVGEIQKRMARGIQPENAPSTIAAKGSSKPLIDTGRLRQSVTYAVVDAEETKQ
jgi:hypothetical protein